MDIKEGLIRNVIMFLAEDEQNHGNDWSAEINELMKLIDALQEMKDFM